MPYFSIYTPTHDPRHIERAARSLSGQTCQDFEWIVMPNGVAKVDASTLPNCRVVEPTDPLTKKIGQLKGECCDAATGEVLVELDHDDELTPDCLLELKSAFSDPKVDFCYSNDADLDKNMQPFTYSKAYGWEDRPFEYKGKTIKEQLSFEPTAASFSKIWFAPNHVRSWRKSFYQRIGGYDKSMEVLDDQDILSRTYIQGNVKFINKCLYVYYRHDGNTCYGEKNKFIQTETLNIHDKYIYQLAEKWSDLNGLLKIDLCGGFNPPHGYKSVDLKDADIIHDLNKPWPFKDGEVGLIRAHDALEHLKDPIHTMKEAHRCLAPLGWFLTMTPSTDGRGAFQDPTHISFWNSNSFWYYTRAETAKYIGTPVRFQLNRIKNYFPNQFCQTHNITYVKADLLKLPEKGSNIRVPGQIEI
jgi:glycosyltransferase involved in cell wall biosynthesis